MSVINSDSVRAGASGAVTAAYTIEQSCRFNDDDGAVLQRTPSIAGNSRTFTISTWFKRCTFDSIMIMYSADSGAGKDVIRFETDNSLSILMEASGGAAIGALATTQLFRDPSAWYHMVFVWDTTNSTAGDRMRLYINGDQVTAFDTDTNPTQNVESAGFNAAVTHAWCHSEDEGTRHFDAYLADVHFIDGQALTAASFGETDDNGQWVPIEFEAGSVGSAATITYTDEDSDTTDQSGPYTLSSMSLGSAGDDRICLIGITGHSGTRTVTTCTVDGNSATHIVSQAGSSNTTELWMVALTDGETSGDVVVQWSGSQARCGVAIWNCIGVSSTPFDVATDEPAISVGIDVPAGGVVAAFFSNNGNTAVTWTAPTERFEVTIENAYTMTGASLAYAAKSTVTVAVSDLGGGEGTMSAVSFGPVDESYGTNGFKLDFSDSSNFGLDVKSTPTAITEEFADSTVGTPNATSHTFSGHALGTAAANRIVVVGAIAEGVSATSITSVTIGGTAATAVATKTKAQTNIGFYTLALALGTTADIIVTANTTAGRWGVGVWAIYGATDGIFHSDSDDGTGLTTTLNVPRLGWAASVAGGVSGSPLAWTGLTEDYDEVLEGVEFHSGASDAFASASMARTVSNDESGHANNAILSVSWAADGDNSFYQSGLATNDQTNDSPTDDADNDIGNYCVLNSISGNNTTELKNGNLQFDKTGGSNYDGYMGTIALPTTGKYYWEVTATTEGSGINQYLGIIASTENLIGDDGLSDNAGPFYFYTNAGAKDSHLDDFATYGTAWADGTIVGIAVDMDNLKIWWSHNGTWQTSGVPDEGTGEAYTLASGATYLPFIQLKEVGDYTFNFGQHSFNSAIGASNDTAGFVTLHTANLPAPAILDPSKYFNVDTYAGTGSENVRTITDSQGGAFKPDLIWGHCRSTAHSPIIQDSARGATVELKTHENGAESTVAESVKSIDTSGYTLGTDTDYNQSSQTHVSWLWYTQGGAGSSNTAGTINTTTTSVGTTQGFSISTYTGNGVVGATVGHGLGVVPDFWMIKDRANANDWNGYHSANTAAPETDYLILNTTAATADSDARWNDTAPTSSVISFGDGSNNNTNTRTYLLYCWAGIEGYSRFGSYEGNGATDGTFVWCGFRPAYLLLKSIDSTSDWHIYDSKREGYNVDNDRLEANTSDAEGTADEVDILSNGFKLRIATDPNVAETYIFAAFAAAPFGGSGVAQARAR